jgi:thymidylate synthase ThyX
MSSKSFVSPGVRNQTEVFALHGADPEVLAFAMAKYSRSALSMRESLREINTQRAEQFLNTFYFQYGHRSIADLAHIAFAVERLSLLAAIVLVDEPRWDGQERSTRYQNFRQSGWYLPDFGEDNESAQLYSKAVEDLFAAYERTTAAVLEVLRRRIDRPQSLKPESYERTLRARAFDVARYLLFWGVPTNVGQVGSIRTLEKQIRRLKAAEYAELRALGEELAQACAAEPDCRWEAGATPEPLAPTLARHADPDEYTIRSRADLTRWAEQNLPPARGGGCERVDLVRPTIVPADIVATLLYPVTDRPFRELYELAAGWSEGLRAEVIDLALGSRTRRDEILAGFRGGVYAYDLVIDIGAYRDLHRHRRCQKFRQAYTGRLGYDTPQLVVDAGVAEVYGAAMSAAFETLRRLPAPGAHYLMPFGARSRFLFKMDFAEAEYISRLRSGVKGHFSYREIAWEMKCKMEQVEPELGRLIEATPPWVDDPLRR